MTMNPAIHPALLVPRPSSTPGFSVEFTADTTGSDFISLRHGRRVPAYGIGPPIIPFMPK